MVLGRISHAKNRMEGPETLRERRWNPRDREIGAPVRRLSRRRLTDASALDFDDLLLKTVELFDRVAAGARALRAAVPVRDGGRVPGHQPAAVPADQAARRRPPQPRVVGDPDQSIYKWRGADLRNILDFEHDFPEAVVVRLERNYRSTQVILDAASAVIAQQPQPQGEDALDRPEGRRQDRLLPRRRRARGGRLHHARRRARRSPTTSSTTMAVLYRTNAQSRSVEDALASGRTSPTSSSAASGFYERKEIKDALSLPEADPEPARRRRAAPRHQRAAARHRQGRDGRARAGRRRAGRRRPAAAARRPAADRRRRTRSGRKLVTAVDQRLLNPRQVASLAAFRDLIVVAGRDGAARDRCRSRSARCSISPAICATCARTAAKRPRARIENLMELVSAAREYETREPEPSLGGFVDRLSLLSDVDKEQGSRDARVLMMTLHSAKGLEFPVVVMAGLEEGLFPHSRSRGGRSRARGGAAPLLRRHHAGADAARAHQRGAAARVRRLPGHAAVAVPRRDSARSRRAGVLDLQLAVSRATRGGWEYRANPYGRAAPRTPDRAREDPPPFDVRQRRSVRAGGLAPGAQVRHGQFGVGTVSASRSWTTT